MKIIIWGTGSFYRKHKFEIWEVLKDYDIEIIAFTDNNASSNKGLTIDGMPVLGCSELQNIEFDKIVLMVGDNFFTVIKHQLIKELGIPNEKISSFLDFIIDVKMINTKEMITKLYFDQKRIENENAEIIWSSVFHDTIKGSKWLPIDFPFSPGRSALGYPALYVLYRILNEISPKSILELGMGQSTKMIGLYSKSSSECVHKVVEHDEDWINFFCKTFQMPKNSEIIQLDILDKDVEFNGRTSNVTTYVNFKETLGNEKFDFICIDGPYGFRSPEYSRIDVLELLPDCLKDSFIIMIDDVDRIGEKNTFMHMESTLKSLGIQCKSAIYSGEKKSEIIVSNNLGFLCTM